MLTPVLHTGNKGAAFRQDQAGNALMTWVLIMLALFSGLLVALAQYSMASTQATQSSRDFVIAGQLSNTAIQNALYEFNAGEYADTDNGSLESGTLGAGSDTYCGSTVGAAILEGAAWDVSKTGCGEYSSAPDTGKWYWEAKPVEADEDADYTHYYEITATGAYGDVYRSVETKIYKTAINGARAEGEDTETTEDDVIGYTAAPSAVFNHALFAGASNLPVDGESTEPDSEDAAEDNGIVWVQGGSSLTVAPYISGIVGTNDEFKIVSPDTDGDGVIDANLPSDLSNNWNVGAVNFYNYAAHSDWEARCTTEKSVLCEPITRMPQKMVLNKDFVGNFFQQCVVTEPWVASENDGVLYTGVANTGCYDSMHFDEDTTIKGNNFYAAFVNGNVTIEPGVEIDALGSANLVIYTDGNVSMDNEDGNYPEGVLDMFVYAPSGTCSFATDPDNAPLTIHGSLACDQIYLEGVTAEWGTPPEGVDAPGISSVDGDSFTKDIWSMSEVSNGDSGRLTVNGGS